MADLIDRQALDVVAFTDRDGTFSDGIQWLLEYIDALPSADAVEVVRCKDCMYSYLHKPWDEEESKRYCLNLRTAWAKDSDLCVEDDDFCSYGRKYKGGE